MVGQFHLRCSEAAAAVLGKKRRREVVKQVVTTAEKLSPDAGDYAIFDVHELPLKVIVHFATREVWIMTRKEADHAGLCMPPPGSNN